MAEKLETGLLKRDKPALSGWPMLVFYWAMILCALHASTHMVGAGDTWVAMACGRHFINHGVDTVEPFSANSHKAGPTEEEVKTWPNWAQKITSVVGLKTVQKWHPTGWVNQNWLTHVIFYWLTHDSPFADAETFDKPIIEQDVNYNSLVYWKYAIYIITVFVVYFTSRNLGVNPALSATAACFAIFIGRTFFDIRPAGFSNMLTAVLLFIYVITLNRNYLYIWLIVPLTVLWCNLHGGFIYVFITLVPFIALHFLRIIPKKISLAILFCGGWVFFGLLAKKFWGNPNLGNLDSPSNVLFYLIGLAIVGRLVMLFFDDIKPIAITVFDLVASAVIISVAMGWLYPPGITRFLRDPIFKAHVADERLTFYVAAIGFVVAAIMLSKLRSHVKVISYKALWHTVFAAVAAFVASIVFNPFHFTNLTHTFIVTVGEDAKLWKTVNEWHPAFEWSNPVGDERPFLIMYIMMWVLLAGWCCVMFLKPKIASTGSRRASGTENDNQGDRFGWPKVDFPLMVIAAMTVYMAVGSRRFIPVAAIAACPLMAMFFDSSVKIISVLNNLKFKGVARVGQMSKFVQWSLFSVATIIVLYLSIWWGFKYKTIYLDPWPESNYLTSEFMRMTASYAKPFKACQFIRDNKMSGKMYNYWTEGGFLAYGQYPDPNTGTTPLQLFMDGRAQAAYDTDVYKRWMRIMSGGPAAETATRAGRKLTQSDYVKVGQWLSEVFRKDDVWAVVMPKGQFNSRLVRGLESVRSDWRTVFVNDSQRIYVDVKSKKGRKLFLNVVQGKAVFPDEFSKNITMGTHLMATGREQDVARSYEMFKKAFSIEPGYTSASHLINMARYKESYRQEISNIMKVFVKDFVENRKTHRKKNDYRNLLIAATIGCDFLSRSYPNDKVGSKLYKEHVKEFGQEQRIITENARW